MKIMEFMKILKFMIFEALLLSDDRLEALERCASAQCSNNLQRRLSSVSNTLAGWSADGGGPDKIRVLTTIFKFFLKSDLITDIIL